MELQVFYNPYKNPNNPFGDTVSVYDFISCWKAPEGNKNESYLTFYSSGKFKFNAKVACCDVCNVVS